MRLDMLLCATTNDLIPELSFGILFNIVYFMLPSTTKSSAFIKQCLKSAGRYQKELQKMLHTLE